MNKLNKKIFSIILILSMIVSMCPSKVQGANQDVNIGTKEQKDNTKALRTFYVDSLNGDDSNDGLTINTPWKTLDKVNETKIVAGDAILLKKGSIFNNQMLYVANVRGTQENPVIITSYGEGNKPIINGNGLNEVNSITKEPYPYVTKKVALPDNKSIYEMYARATVLITNSEYVELSDVEVTNWDDTIETKTEKNLMGICVQNMDAGELKHIYVTDCNVKKVNGGTYSKNFSSMKATGGIIVRVDIEVKLDENNKPILDENNEVPEGVKSWFNDIKIENNYLEDVSREGIYTTSDWMRRASRCDATEGKRPYVASKNISIAGNTVKEAGGDGIVLIGFDGGEDLTGAVVEHNTSINVNVQGKSRGRNHAAVWVWNADNNIFQYNEVYGTHNTGDGQAFDFDYGVDGSLLQYNYSHDNEGGFLLFCSCGGGTSSTYNNVARYNISVNDAAVPSSRIFNVAGPFVTAEVYNNTFYFDEKTEKVLLTDHYNGQYKPREINFYNNIFYDAAKRNDASLFAEDESILYSNNLYYGSAPVSDKNAIFADPQFINPSIDAKLGLDAPTGFGLKANSPCIDTGVTLTGKCLEGNITHNGGRDYFGNKLNDNYVDIGAVEFVGNKETPVIEKPDFTENEPEENPDDKDKVYNDNYDFKEGTKGWYNSAGTFTVVDDSDYGKAALLVNGANIEQGFIDGYNNIKLESNTQYKISAYVKSVSGKNIRIGVKKFLGSNNTLGEGRLFKDIKDKTWTYVEIPFTTGSTDKSANIFAFNEGNGDGGYVADFKLTKVSTEETEETEVLNKNGGFEQGLDSWTTTDSNKTVINTTDVKSGKNSLLITDGGKLTQGSGAVTLEQYTKYQLKAYVKAKNSGSVKIGVTDFTINEDDNKKFETITSNEWQPVIIEFSTGVNITTANIVIEGITEGGYVDDVYITKVEEIVEPKISIDFDDNSANDSKQKANGTLVGNPTFKKGVFNDCIYFENTDQYVKFEGENKLIFEKENFSISFWYKGNNDDKVIFGNGNFDSGANQGMTIAAFTNGIQLNVNPQQGKRNEIGRWVGNTGNNNKWHNVAVTVNRKGNIELYIDGNLIEKKDISQYAEYTLDNENLYVLGADGLGKYGISQSYIDEFKVFDQVISASQIKELAKKPVDTKNTYEITVETIGNGIVTPETTTVNEGDNFSAIIKEANGYAVEKILVDGEEINRERRSVSFNEISESHKISVIFKEKKKLTQDMIDVYDLTYSGEYMNNPVIKLMDTDMTFADLSYTIEPKKYAEDNIAITFTANAKGLYDGEVVKTYSIKKANLSGEAKFDTSLIEGIETSVNTSNLKGINNENVDFEYKWSINEEEIKGENTSVIKIPENSEGKIIKVTISDKNKNYNDVEVAGKIINTSKPEAPKPTQVTGTEIKDKTYNSITIKWNKNADAVSYKVYRATSKNGAYSYIGTTKQDVTVYKDNKVTTGKTYYYKVAAVNNNGIGEMSSYTYTMAAPYQVKSAYVHNYGRQAFKIGWAKQSGVTGYRVYKATSRNGKYERIATVRGDSNTTFVDKKVKTGKTYYYKVRAYKTVSGKMIFGSYSGIKYRKR